MRLLGALVALWVLLAAAPAGAQPSPAVEKGSSVKMEYTLKDDKGQVLDSSDGKEPIAFVQGAHQIIPGLDKALLGMKVGDTKKVTVKPDEGYGVVPRRRPRCPRMPCRRAPMWWAPGSLPAARTGIRAPSP